MGVKIDMEPSLFCAFCGRPRRLVSKLVQCGTPIVYGQKICICDECVDAAYEIVHEGDEDAEAE